MMTCLESASHRLTSALGLETPPVALAFVDRQPAGVEAAPGAAPSACAFWRTAESKVFYASAAQHFNCPIGAMVMGFELPESCEEQLNRAVELMSGCGYLDAAEPPRIPTIQQPAAGVVYGPLDRFPQQPDAVLLWLGARQAMLYAEAIGGCRWNAAAPIAVLGRPACAAIPAAANKGSTLSLGCAGMRTFTAISDDRLLAVIPGDQVEKVAADLCAAANANAQMQHFYDERNAGFRAGLAPNGEAGA